MREVNAVGRMPRSPAGLPNSPGAGSAKLSRGLLLLLLPIASLLSCGRNPSGPGPEGGRVRLVIADGRNRTPPAYSIHATPAGGTTISACCSGASGNDGAVTALEDGCLIATSAESLSIVVKADGYRTARIAWSRRAYGRGPLAIRLDGLDGDSVSPDYANGFPEEGGRERFLAMSVEGSGENGTTHTVKFYIDRLDSAPVVYFQNTARHPLHYDFVRDVLGRPLTLREFEERTYQGAGRTAMAGSLVWRTGFSAPGGSPPERIDSPMTVEFFPSDDLTPGQALAACALLEERIRFPGTCGKANRIHYLPATAAQETELAGRAGAFRAEGLRWITREALYRGIGMQLLNTGEAYGWLRFVPPESLAVSPLSFRDILLLPRLPNELPLVAGTITEEFQTPLAHVNVAARARKSPNLALPAASARPGIAALRDSLVHFKVSADTFLLEKAPLAEAEAFWEKIRPHPPTLPEPDMRSDLEPFSRLGFGDRNRIGVKAANLAELSNLPGGFAPAGFAVPFARYSEFLGYARMNGELCAAAAADCVEEGRDRGICAEAAEYRTRFCDGRASLRTFIDTLLDDSRFLADSRYREAALDGLRHLMRHIPVDTAFGRGLDALADSLFHGKRLRLRSSTNAEDLEDFTGAGLYSSTGADAGGPEHPASEIRKVWAGVWNWQAFEERSLWGIDHRKVYMGVAVHPAFTDEAANGVLVTRNLADPGIDGLYVNVQPGETSVTNPADGSLPEIFTIVGGDVIRRRYSSLSPDAPVLSGAEIARLGEVAQRLHNHFAKLYGKDPRDPAYALDIEFKLDVPDRTLYIKQVRPYAP